MFIKKGGEEQKLRGRKKEKMKKERNRNLPFQKKIFINEAGSG